MSLSNQICRAHLDDDAYFHDVQYHQHMETLRRALSEADQALEKCGHDEHMRHQILTAILTGPPDVHAAHTRIAESAQALREAMTRPPAPITLNRTDLPDFFHP